MSMYHFLKRSFTDRRRRNVIWIADTNYRVELDNDIVRHLAENDELDALVASDQVSHRALHFFQPTSNFFLDKAQERNGRWRCVCWI